jgi:PEP-CTERM motif
MKVLFRLCVALILMVMAAPQSQADTVNLGATGWDANANFSASSGNWTLTLSFVNTSGQTTDLNSFAIQLFNSGSNSTFTVSSATLGGQAATITAGGGSGSASNSWEFFANDKLNNGSTPDCNTTSISGWMCADSYYNNAFHGSTINPLLIANGTTATFTFVGTYSGTTPIATLDLMASGCLVAGTCKLDGGSSNTSKWAVSAPMGTSVPEPSSMLMLGTGLASFLGVIRIRKRR